MYYRVILNTFYVSMYSNKIWIWIKKNMNVLGALNLSSYLSDMWAYLSYLKMQEFKTGSFYNVGIIKSVPNWMP